MKKGGKQSAGEIRTWKRKGNALSFFFPLLLAWTPAICRGEVCELGVSLFFRSENIWERQIGAISEGGEERSVRGRK